MAAVAEVAAVAEMVAVAERWQLRSGGSSGAMVADVRSRSRPADSRPPLYSWPRTVSVIKLGFLIRDD